MGYTKTVWNEKSVPGISGAKLNKIEQGIYEAHERITNMQEIPSGGTSADAALYDINIGFDGTNHESPGESVRAQAQQLDDKINEVSGQLSNEIVEKHTKVNTNKVEGFAKSVNKFNKYDDDIIYGGYYALVNSEVSWHTDSRYAQSGFIPFKSGDKLYRSVGGGVLNWGTLPLARYDENKQQIGISTTTNGSEYFSTTVMETAYIRVPILIADIDSYMLIVNDEVPSEYVPYVGITAEEIVKGIDEKKADIKSVNRFNYNDSDVVNGVILDYVNGEIKENKNSAYSESGYIPCKQGDTIRFRTYDDSHIPSQLRALLFDSNKGVLSGVYVTPNGYTITGEQVAFVRVPFQTAYKDKYILTINEKIPSYYVSYFDDLHRVVSELKIVNENNSHWFGKKWYAYGTSLTDVASGTGKYVPYLAELSGLNVYNKGIGGGALVANRNIYNRLMDNTDGKVEADLITIEVGANDFSTPLGEPTSMDNTTFCGALNTCIKNVLMNCPKAQVVIMPSTISRYELGNSSNLYNLDSERGDGTTYLERDEAIRKVAVANGVYYIPFGSGLGLGLFRQQSSNLYNVDQIHHTDLGGYNLAQGVWGYLKNIPLWYSELPQ